MVSFTGLAATLAAVSALVPATGAAPLEARAATSQKIVTFFGQLTQLSRNIEPYAQKVTAVNGLLVVTGQEPLGDVVKGLDDSSTKVDNEIQTLEGTTAFTAGTQTESVVSAFSKFGDVHEQLLDILIGKAGLFSVGSGVDYPMTDALEQDESLLNRVALSLADAAPSGRSAIGKRSTALMAKLRKAQQAYGGIHLGPGHQ